MNGTIGTLATGLAIFLSFATGASAATLDLDEDTVVVAEGSSSTMNAEQICGGFFSSSTTLECMRIVKDSRYLDDKAVAVCKGLFSTEDTLKCLRSVKNRTYAQSDINLCRGFYGTKELIECLENGGERAKKKKGFSVVHVEVPAPSATLSSAGSDSGGSERRKVVAALKQIEAGNLKAAKRLLREYLEATE